MMAEFNAIEVLEQILDEAKVPLIRRHWICREDMIASVEVNGDDETHAKILVDTYNEPPKIRVISYGNEFVGLGDPRLIVEEAADYIRRWVYWEVIKLSDIFGEIEDEVEDDVRELMRS